MAAPRCVRVPRSHPSWLVARGSAAGRAALDKAGIVEVRSAAVGEPTLAVAANPKPQAAIAPAERGDTGRVTVATSPRALSGDGGRLSWAATVTSVRVESVTDDGACRQPLAVMAAAIADRVSESCRRIRERTRRWSTNHGSSRCHDRRGRDPTRRETALARVPPCRHRARRPSIPATDRTLEVDVVQPRVPLGGRTPRAPRAADTRRHPRRPRCSSGWTRSQRDHATSTMSATQPCRPDARCGSDTRPRERHIAFRRRTDITGEVVDRFDGAESDNASSVAIVGVARVPGRAIAIATRRSEAAGPAGAVRSVRVPAVEHRVPCAGPGGRCAGNREGERPVSPLISRWPTRSRGSHPRRPVLVEGGSRRDTRGWKPRPPTWWGDLVRRCNGYKDRCRDGAQEAGHYDASVSPSAPRAIPDRHRATRHRSEQVRRSRR